LPCSNNNDNNPFDQIFGPTGPMKREEKIDAPAAAEPELEDTPREDDHPTATTTEELTLTQEERLASLTARIEARMNELKVEKREKEREKRAAATTIGTATFPDWRLDPTMSGWYEIRCTNSRLQGADVLTIVENLCAANDDWNNAHGNIWYSVPQGANPSQQTAYGFFCNVSNLCFVDLILSNVPG
jgi:hypothetical protein